MITLADRAIPLDQRLALAAPVRRPEEEGCLIMITIDDLIAADACQPAQDAFVHHFPNGAPSWLAIAQHPACRPDWRGWIAVNAAIDMPLADRLALADTSDDPAFRRALIANNAGIDMPMAERLAIAETSDDPAYWRGQIAVNADIAMPMAERLAIAATSDHPAYWRGEIARHFTRED